MCAAEVWGDCARHITCKVGTGGCTVHARVKHRERRPNGRKGHEQFDVSKGVPIAVMCLAESDVPGQRRRRSKGCDPQWMHLLVCERLTEDGQTETSCTRQTTIVLRVASPDGMVGEPWA